jgi:hypothetical protein
MPDGVVVDDRGALIEEAAGDGKEGAGAQELAGDAEDAVLGRLLQRKPPDCMEGEI